MIELKESKTRDIPLWVTGVVILLCALGGVWLVKWYMKEQPQQVIDVPEDKVPANLTRNTGWRGFTNGNNNGFRNNRVRDTNANGITTWGQNSFRVKVGDVIMTVNYSPSGRFDISPQYQNQIRTPEQAELVVMRMSILTDASWRDYLNVTEDQLAKLRAVPAPKSMTISDDEKAKLTTLWKAYHEAAQGKKTEPEKELLTALEEVAKKNLPATKEYEANRAALVRAALTDEQIKKYKDSGGKPGAKEIPVPGVNRLQETKTLESKPAISKPLIETIKEVPPATKETPAAIKQEVIKSGAATPATTVPDTKPLPK